jgi:hypothetical protein
MAFTTITITEDFPPESPGGPVPAGEVVFTLSERIHDGAGDEVEPEPITANLNGVITLEANGASAGTFKLTWNDLQTATIAYNAAASAVLSALNALTGFSALGATASGGPANSAPVVITIPGNPYAITADFTGLTGGANTISSIAAISQPLYANDDTTTVPTGSTYTVEFFLQGISQRPPIEITVPHTAGSGTCTLASLS